MDPRSPADAAPPSDHISALINAYFDRRQAGEALTPDQFVAEHPEAADALRPYLDGMTLVQAARVRASGASTSDDSAATGRAALPAIEGYQLVQEIGRGGMGVVYKALQVSTRRVVALKVMLAGPFASARSRRRFDREVQLAARLQHAGIVRVLESGDVAGQRYYAMDYVDGVRLDRYVSHSQSNVRATLELFQRVCEAVEYAHANGVIHRDLKPANVLIDKTGDPHVLDFGLAKAAEQGDAESSLSTPVSLPGQVVGTLSYLSPEQAAGIPETVDARTDIYALGVMLFEALTGALPFDSTGSSSEVIQRNREVAPIPPSSLSDRVDADLETIILKALAKEKNHRYQSARALADDLARYLDGEPILARRPSSLYVLGKKLRKHRLWVVGGVAACAVVLFGALAGWQARRDERVAARLSAVRLQAQVEGGNTDQVLGAAQALYEANRRLPDAQLVWAHAQFRNEDARDSAILQLERVLERDPSRWECRALLAEMYDATGDAERAETLRASTEAAVPDTADAWYLRSLATLDLERAIRCAEQCLKRRPADVSAWHRLTRLHLITGDLEQALNGADQLIMLGADLGEWTVFKGQILARQGRFRDAIAEYTRVVDTCNVARLYRAHAYRRIHEYELAVADYNQLLPQQGEATADAWQFYQRATPLWILGRSEEALADYRRVRVRLGRPFYSDARSYLILRELGRPDEAQAVLDAALADTPVSWLRRIFRCLAEQIEPEALIAAAGSAIRDRPQKLCEAHYYAGEVHLLAGRRDQARACFEACVQTGVDFDPDLAIAVPMNEFELAQWRLESLFDDASTSRPSGN